MTVDRRRVVGTGLALGAAALASGAEAAETAFRHGVASGEPGADRMLLWTRVTGLGEADGRWRIATDPAMRKVVGEGRFIALAERDFTVKVMAQGLKPATDYWYQFEAGGQRSPVGRARTLPVGRLDHLDLVVACCAMYTMGYFQAYRAIAERPKLDVVLFVGDYIYEYGASNYPGLPTLRPADPPRDTVTLDDYRRRFAQARTDVDLQAAHQRAPWICTWDDHEIANDDWMHGAQHHDPTKDGDWEVRKAAAVRAYCEWMPIRDPDPADPYAIQRAVAFGDLVTLIVPETRLKARAAQLALPKDLDRLPDQRPDLDGFRRKIADPERRMLGQQQVDWIAGEMRGSVAAGRPWVLLGSATVMADYVYPDMSRWAPTSGALKGFFELTKLDLPLLNLDAWSGYAAERQRVYDAIRASGARTVVLSGDSHMAFVNELHDEKGRVAVELSTSTLTGPSLGVVLAMKDAPFGDRVAERNRDVVWCDHLAIGFVAVHVTREAVEASFISVTDPRVAGSPTPVRRRVRAVAEAKGVSAWTQL
jgi:alkaline phosphatase D